MKVRQDPPAHPGNNGKQGGERFRTILKYPIATDMAMKRYRVNDTLQNVLRLSRLFNAVIIDRLALRVYHFHSEALPVLILKMIGFTFPFGTTMKPTPSL